jgi:hypothetical protein
MSDKKEAASDGGGNVPDPGAPFTTARMPQHKDVVWALVDGTWFPARVDVLDADDPSLCRVKFFQLVGGHSSKVVRWRAAVQPLCRHNSGGGRFL